MNTPYRPWRFLACGVFPHILTSINRISAIAISHSGVMMGSISTSTQGAPDSQLVLSDALWRERVPHINGENYFLWPYPILKRLITRETIIRQLDTVKIGLEDAEACSDVILGTDKTSFLRVFAILAIVERSGDIQAFIDADMHDERFPLVQGSEHHLTAQICMAKLGWSQMQRDYFNINQLRMSPRFFALEEDYEARHYDMPKGQMLPWVLCRDSYGVHEETLSGGCGQVVKYKIDANSHGFAPLLEKLGFYGSFVAVKSLKGTNKEKGTPNKELEMLKQFSGLSQPNIITLLATYTLNSQFHFIFPAAEYDLLMYWKIHPGPQVNPASVNSEGLLWLSGQIRNIVGALAHIHEGKKAHMNTETMFGRHGDIKPANILWFRSRKEQRGVFVISDFGIADAHREDTRSIIPAADLPVTPRYRAPECDIRDGRISRAYDVWSLGCVLLEMTCWILGANELREQFKEILMSPYITGVKTDIYFDIHWLGPGEGYRLSVKEQIVRWIRSLHNKPSCSSYVHDLLDMIHEYMLVVDQSRRKSMTGILDAVEEMHQRAINSIGYLRDPETKEVILEARYMDGMHLNDKIESILEYQEEKRKQLNEASH